MPPILSPQQNAQMMNNPAMGVASNAAPMPSAASLVGPMMAPPMMGQAMDAARVGVSLTGPALVGSIKADRNEAAPSMPSKRMGASLMRKPDLTAMMSMLADAEKTIEAQQARIAYLESLAVTDELTGLLNRRGMHLALEREMAAAKRDAHQAGVLVMMDLDRFKDINDTWGHPAGDRYLKAVADTLLRSVRKTDMVARMGGDEFAVLFTRTAPSLGEMRAEGMMQQLRRTIVDWQGWKMRLAASYGIMPVEGDHSLEEVMAKADLRLYTAKQARPR